MSSCLRASWPADLVRGGDPPLKSTRTLRVDQAKIIGTQPAYGLLDLTGSAQLNQMTIQVVVTNVADRRAQLSRFVQTNPQADNQPYVVPAQPRTVAIQFGQKF